MQGYTKISIVYLWSLIFLFYYYLNTMSTALSDLVYDMDTFMTFKILKCLMSLEILSELLLHLWQWASAQVRYSPCNQEVGISTSCRYIVTCLPCWRLIFILTLRMFAANEKVFKLFSNHSFLFQNTTQDI